MQSGKNARAIKVNKNQNPPSFKKGGGGKPKKGPKGNISGSRNRNKQFSAAAAYSTGNSGKAPNVTMSKDSCRVIHRELLGNVSGTATAAFTVANTFALNPGVSQTFPWLSNMAQNWETYRFNKVRVCYYTRTGSNTAGSVIMVPDYDASDASPISEQTASSYEDIQEDAPWKDIMCSLRPGAMHPNGPKKFVRPGPLAANQDIKMYDAGNLFICTVDSAAAASWGKLWIEYDVTFYTPQLNSGGSNFSSISMIQGNGALSNADFYGVPIVTGNLGATATLKRIDMTNLIIGAEYLYSCSVTGTVITNFNILSNAGFTPKTSLFVGFNAAGTQANVTATFTANAVIGRIDMVSTATTITATETILCLAPISGF